MFIATNALGLGVDTLQIQVVIHVSVIQQLYNYIQESRQARRNRQASKAIIVQVEQYNRGRRLVEETAEQASGYRVEQAI